MNQAKVKMNAKKQEAKTRLCMLGMDHRVITEYVDHDAIPVCLSSEKDRIYFITRDDDDGISQFEDKYNTLVYLIFCDSTILGKMKSYLYISDEIEEWNMDRADIKDGYCMTYTENLTYPMCSEFGSISIEQTGYGTLRRIG